MLPIKQKHTKLGRELCDRPDEGRKLNQCSNGHPTHCSRSFSKAPEEIDKASGHSGPSDGERSPRPQGTRPTHHRRTRHPKENTCLLPTAKLQVPTSFSGNNATVKAIDNWSLSVSTYLIGSDIDPNSLLAAVHIGNALEGNARKWFVRNVLPEIESKISAKNSYEESPWPLSKVVDGLKTRFVADDNRRAAQVQLERLTQHLPNGDYISVQEIYDKIIDLAPSCFQCTEFDQRRAFFNAMDFEIAMVLNRNHKPEGPGVTLKGMRDFAKVEEQTIVGRRFQSLMKKEGVHVTHHEAMKMTTKSRHIKSVMKQAFAHDATDRSPRPPRSGPPQAKLNSDRPNVTCYN